MSLPWPNYTTEEWEVLLAEEDALSKGVSKQFIERVKGGQGSGNFGHAGRPGEVGGSGAGGGASDYKVDSVKWDQKLDANGRPIPIKVDTVEEAIPLVLDGKVVEMPTVESAATLIGRLGQMANEAKAAGKEAKNYDLCKVSVAGTNMFCGSPVHTAEFPNGIPRIKMPQFDGEPVPGSAASKLPPVPWDKTHVDASAQFIDYLKTSLAINVTDASLPAAYLKASQAELVGTKVAKMMVDKSFDPASNPIFISRDNYVIDGHHRWAAVVARDAEDNRLGDINMKVHIIDAPISEVLHIANNWATGFGLRQAAGVKKSKILTEK